MAFHLLQNQNIKVKLLKKEELRPGIFKFSVQAEEIIKTAKPGNFIEIRVNDDIEPFLRRPISIHNIYKEEKMAVNIKAKLLKNKYCTRLYKKMA